VFYSRTDLENRVRGFHRQFDNVRSRTFVAVFMQRLVRRSIEQSFDEPSAVAAQSRVRTASHPPKSPLAEPTDRKPGLRVE
jgi:hypothetical protein